MTKRAEDMTVRQAGRLGGLTVLRNRGSEFFSEIGCLGQRAMRQKYPHKARQWGQLGGRPRKPALAEILGGESE